MIYKRALLAYEIASINRDQFCMFEAATPVHSFEIALAIQELAGVSVIRSTALGELDSPVRELAGAAAISSTAYGELTGGQEAARRVRSQVGFKPVKDDDRLRGLRRNALY